MNWAVFAKWTIQILAMVPGVVAGIEGMVTGAKQGATKKDLAMAALGLSNAVASNVIPEHQPAIDAATKLASAAIDNTVTLMNAIGHPAFVSVPSVAAPAVPAFVAPVTEDVAQPGPGLHNVVPA